MKFILAVVLLSSLASCQPGGGGPPPGGSGGGMMMVGGATLETNYNYADSSKDPLTDPLVTSWKKSGGWNSTYSAYTNINKIQYSNKYVYVSASALPSYSIGPWPNNPNSASNQKFLFQFPRVPVEKTVNKTKLTLNTVGVWLHGVPIYNADDGQNVNGWARNAYHFEKESFDSCGGHPQQQGVYHIHTIPSCLLSTYNDSSAHSPIIGFANDGFPVYGPFGYSVAMNPSSAIRRMATSFRLRSSMTNRTTLSSGATVIGPAINSTYPLGAFLDDFEFVSGLGDLDVSGGRLCVTPEYPNGTYAYFLPIDASGNPTYPYTLGLYYYGHYISKNAVDGKTTVSETVTLYYTADSVVLKSGVLTLSLALFVLSRIFL